MNVYFGVFLMWGCWIKAGSNWSHCKIFITEDQNKNYRSANEDLQEEIAEVTKKVEVVRNHYDTSIRTFKRPHWSGEHWMCTEEDTNQHVNQNICRESWEK